MAKSLPESLAQAFKTIVEVVKKNGFFKTLTSIVLFGMFSIIIYIFINQDLISKKIAQNQEEVRNREHVEKIEFRMNYINPRVDGILSNLLLKTKADRAYIIEMHNGSDNPSGLPFVYGDLTYEKVSSNETELVGDEYGNMNLSKVPFALVLYKNKYWVGDITQIKKIDPKLGSKMELNGAKFIYMFLLRGNVTELGFLGLTYNNQKPNDLNKIFGEALTASQEISILLDYSNNSKITK